MSDFEQISIFQDMANSMFNLLAIYFSIVFAFTAAGFVAAGKLNQTLAIVVVALFTIAAGFFILFTSIVFSNMIALQMVITDAVGAGESSLGWVGFTQSAKVSVLSPVVFVLLYSLLGLSYFGALFFFFYQRRVSRQAVH